MPVHVTRRRVTFVGDVDVRDVNAVVVPRVRSVAGDGESRCRGRKTHSTAAKPPTGFRIQPGHFTPSLNVRP
jgi:hypothetical protein